EGQNFGRVMDTAYGVALANFAARAADALLQIVPQIYELATAAEETANKFDVVFGDAADSVDKFLESWAHMAGMTITQGRDMSATMGSILLGMGFTKGAAADMSVAIMKLAGDMQSFDNVPIEEALQAIRSGLVGEIEPLSKFGVKFGEADVKMKAAQMTGKKLNGVFSEGEKVAARFALMVERQQHKLGDLVNTQDSTANATRRAYATMEEKAQQLAQSLLPVFASLANAANEFMTNNEEAITSAIEGIGAALVFTARVVGEFIGTMADIAKLVSEHKDLVIKAASAYALYTGAVNAATIAQGLFNLFVRANKLVILISSLLAIVEIQKRYKAELLESKAASAEFQAGMMEGLQNLLSAIRTFLTYVPDWLGGKAAVSRVDKGLAWLEEHKTFFRKWADEQRAQAAEYRANKEKETKANEDNADSVLNLADLQEILANSLNASSEEMRKQIQAMIDAKGEAKKTGKSYEALVAQTERMGEAVRRHREEELKTDRVMGQNLPGSINALNQKLRVLQDMYNAATDDMKRAELSKLMDETRESIDRLSGKAGGGEGSIAALEAQLAKLRDAFKNATSQADRDEIAATITAYEDAVDRMSSAQSRQEQAAKSVSGSLQDATSDMVATFAEAFAGVKGLGDVGDTLIDQFATLAERIGKLMIGFGVSGIALKKLLENPYTAIAAGIALIALAEGARSVISHEVGGAGGYSNPTSSPQLSRNQTPFAGGINGFGGSAALVTQQSFQIGVDVNVKGETVSKGTDLVHTFKATEHRSIRAGNT
ncbi:MAG TPA: hypothetical protein VKA63_02600, partial [Candidatus Krumholzibacteria bacterium]|nr:hypothetical protein [Candidatus Krumholzibacteria bacterium]